MPTQATPPRRPVQFWVWFRDRSLQSTVKAWNVVWRRGSRITRLRMIEGIQKSLSTSSTTGPSAGSGGSTDLAESVRADRCNDVSGLSMSSWPSQLDGVRIRKLCSNGDMLNTSNRDSSGTHCNERFSSSGLSTDDNQVFNLLTRLVFVFLIGLSYPNGVPAP